MTYLFHFPALTNPETTIVLDFSHNKFTMIPSKEFPNPLQTMLERFCNYYFLWPFKELRLAGSDLMGQRCPDRLNCASSLSVHPLQVLDLASCNLSGPVSGALFNSIMNLTFLNLSDNRLSGAIPDRLPLTLRALDLSSNNMQGEIPGMLFAGMSKLLHLNASNNKLSGGLVRGTFPPNLRVLDLSHNRLTGGIPSNFFFALPNLTYINLSGNDLSGPIPDGLSFYDASFFADNPQLCGAPLLPCFPQSPVHVQGTSVVKMKVWVLVTVVFATVVGAVVLACTGSCWLLVWRGRVYSKQRHQDADSIATLLERETVTVMPLRELRRATSNFSESAQIGDGCFGTVYSGILADGTVVAIKMSKSEASSEYKKMFLNEVKTLSAVNHRHLVKLLGCSMDNEIALLIFEFVPKGTLKEHLQGTRPGFAPLGWGRRLLIALQASDALAYLHSAADPPIFHLNVKSSNILLDYDLNAKVADFGISKLAPSKAATDVAQAPTQGSVSYIEPESVASFHLTPGSDVYSFGLVLLELISGKPAVDLGNLAISSLDKGEWEELIDPVLADTYSSDNGKAAIDFVGALAVKCLASRSRERPGMREVWKELHTIWLHSDSFIHSDHVRHYGQTHNGDAHGDGFV